MESCIKSSQAPNSQAGISTACVIAYDNYRFIGRNPLHAKVGAVRLFVSATMGSSKSVVCSEPWSHMLGVFGNHTIFLLMFVRCLSRWLFEMCMWQSYATAKCD